MNMFSYKTLGAALAAALCSAQAAAEPIETLRFDCDLAGVGGQMTMRVNLPAESAAATTAARPTLEEIVTGADGATYLLQGELRSPFATYSMRGENAYADFTETQSGGGFRVKFVAVESDFLRLIVDPDGSTLPQYSCRRS